MIQGPGVAYEANLTRKTEKSRSPWSRNIRASTRGKHTINGGDVKYRSGLMDISHIEGIEKDKGGVECSGEEERNSGPAKAW